jgi:hypothetical protein
MTNLNWRPADVVLTDKVVPNPRAEHDLLARLHNVRVAVEGSFLHIDPRPNGEPAYPGQGEYTVTVVPSSSVVSVCYKATMVGNMVAVD